ncbi:MAG TPA: hypothetical protein VMW17_07795 [Candidatus Binatia bacterium]|nr:hypothetical protein [Candidatus Binatia bacterium]
MQALLAILALSALVVAIVAARSQRRLSEAAQTRELLHAVTASAESEPMPAVAPKPLLDHLDAATGWIVATGDGVCVRISDRAREALGVETIAPPRDLSLSDLFENGAATMVGLLDELRRDSVAPARRVHPAADPTRALELAGVALRDRRGNLWGATLLVRPDPRGAAHPLLAR